MNNSATTRTITKIALQYNGNDKGTAEMIASNYLLSDTAEGQFLEMKIVANRNPKVEKWALTGYISQPNEIGRKLTDEEFLEIATKALEKIGVTENNQSRLDIHNSTKQKHIHFVVNRIDISGKCTIKAQDEVIKEIPKEVSVFYEKEQLARNQHFTNIVTIIEAVISQKTSDYLESLQKPAKRMEKFIWSGIGVAIFTVLVLIISINFASNWYKESIKAKSELRQDILNEIPAEGKKTITKIR
ncbi:relaxase/mobilization nuclease domain-containing protein [Chryseobacterium luquanense]|uniref:Relaxase/mobilization nuclease domain-containing protein n=1 Tax=Chryseobacterium luquanense TaxID=2983766 RepID=A0ABT3Y3T2_9FLAO|nr:relaxase/mobilization nuclease domain-containing protein [Chryseobacterium luquanense]MCX8532686.1 relaxase/mobilization nuclease domain-containing protein [Chryseobacterium luquanense]